MTKVTNHTPCWVCAFADRVCQQRKYKVLYSHKMAQKVLFTNDVLVHLPFVAVVFMASHQNQLTVTLMHTYLMHQTFVSAHSPYLSGDTGNIAYGFQARMSNAPSPSGFCRHILSLRTTLAVSNKRCLHSLSGGSCL